MYANVGIIASGLKQVLKIPISLEEDLQGGHLVLQGGHLDLRQLHSFSLIRKHTAQTSCTARSSNILPGQFPVFVKGDTLKEETILIDVNTNDSVEDLNQSLEDREGIPIDQQRLIKAGRQMKDNHTLSDFNVRKHDTIHLALMLTGGQETYSLLPEKLLDPPYDFVYPGIGQDSRSFSRGNRSFARPYGWKKIALKVLGEYENDEWLGVSREDETDSAGKEWPVSYHGTQKEFAEAIAEEGYSLEKCERFLYGRGIYSSPDPEVAESYASSFNYEGDNYKLIFMNRVNMKFTKEVETTNGQIYFVTSNDRHIRPYAILLKKL